LVILLQTRREEEAVVVGFEFSTHLEPAKDDFIILLSVAEDAFHIFLLFVERLLHC